MPEQRYSREDVDSILGRALERERSADDLDRDQLIAVAREIGVSAESIDRAIEEVVVERQKREELALLRRQAWRGFVGHLIPYLCVNALLVVLNVLTTRFPWALFPMLGWGIGLMSHLLAVAMPNPERLARRLRRERERQTRRQLKRHVKTSAKELEVAVGQGVAALLQAAANRVQQGAESLNRQDSPKVRVESAAHRETPHDGAESGSAEERARSPVATK